MSQLQPLKNKMILSHWSSSYCVAYCLPTAMISVIVNFNTYNKHLEVGMVVFPSQKTKKMRQAQKENESIHHQLQRCLVPAWATANYFHFKYI